MEMEKLTQLSDKALVHHELQLERDLIRLGFQHKTGQLDDPSQLKGLRRGIARAQTVARQRELAQGLRQHQLRNLYRSSFVPGEVVTAEDAPKSGGFLKGIANKLGIGETETE